MNRAQSRGRADTAEDIAAEEEYGPRDQKSPLKGHIEAWVSESYRAHQLMRTPQTQPKRVAFSSNSDKKQVVSGLALNRTA
jgi:hypothetical protein